MFAHTPCQWISTLIFIINDQQIFRDGFIEIFGTVSCLVLITFSLILGKKNYARTFWLWLFFNKLLVVRGSCALNIDLIQVDGQACNIRAWRQWLRLARLHAGESHHGIRCRLLSLLRQLVLIYAFDKLCPRLRHKAWLFSRSGILCTFAATRLS